MKNLILILLLIFISSCNSNADKKLKYKWLAGKWQRLDDKPGNTTFEKWNITIDGKYIGHGYTLRDLDTVFKERLVIKPKSKLANNNNDPWVLQVTGVNESPTIFEIKESTDYSFTAVNLENEFPTHINYAIVNDSLKAQVYNDEMSIYFTFIKL